jgi:hypothetical protein
MNWFSGNNSTSSVADVKSTTYDWDSSSTGCDSGFNSTPWEPSVNINGLPMAGGIDLNGNTYGDTSHDHQFDTSISTDHYASMGSDNSWCGSNDSFSCGGDWNSF